MKGEIWRAIRDFEDFYEVSNFGNVRNVAREKRRQFRALLKPDMTRNGYARFPLYKDRTRLRVLGHVLVARAFIANPHQKKQVNHKDGNKSNNHVSNLEWVTASENTFHAYITGLIASKKYGFTLSSN